MLAVFVNCGAIILGSIIGLLFSKKFTEELSDMIQTAAGVITMVLGIQMAFKYDSIVFLALSLIIGAIIGYALDIDGAILRFGKWLEKLVDRKKKAGVANESAGANSNAGVANETAVINSPASQDNGTKLGAKREKNFAYAFLNASVLFCVGAMAIVGSFKAGVEHDYTIIFTKSILDGFMAISFTAAMGIGTLFSIISVLVYQGLLTLLSTWIQPYVTELLIQEVSACGGAIIVMIGINLLGLKKIKTANFLPALVIEIIFVICVPLIKGLFV